MKMFKRAGAPVIVGCLVGALSGPVHSETCPISKLRENYRVVSNNVAVEEIKKNPDPIDEWSVEEDSCLSSYGANIGVGLTGLASGFLDNLKDRVCSALDGYVSGQLDELGAAINAPMDLAGVTVGIGGSDDMLNTDLTVSDISPDVDSVIRDAINQAPTIDDGYVDYEGGDGRRIDDYDYIDRGRGSGVSTPDFLPSGSGRR